MEIEEKVQFALGKTAVLNQNTGIKKTEKGMRISIHASRQALFIKK